MICWCMLHLIWDRRPWCCRIDQSDDRVDLVFSHLCSQCTDCIILSHTFFPLHPEFVSWVHHTCWCDWCICVVPLYVDHGAVDGMHWLPLVGQPALVVVQRVWCTLLGIRSRIVLPTILGQRVCVLRRQVWWEECRSCHKSVGLVDWCSHNLDWQVVEVGFLLEISRWCRQRMSASPMCWSCAVKVVVTSDDVVSLDVGPL